MNITSLPERLSHQRVYTDVLANLPSLLTATLSDDSDLSRAAFARILAAVALAKSWCRVEQEKVWPSLMLGSSGGSRVKRWLQLQMDYVEPGINGLECALRAWLESPTDPSGAAEAFEHHEEVFQAALNDWVKVGLPATLEVISDEQWNRLQVEVITRVDAELQGLVLGLVLETKTPDTQRQLLSYLPTNLRQSWSESERVNFSRHQALVDQIVA